MDRRRDCGDGLVLSRVALSKIGGQTGDIWGRLNNWPRHPHDHPCGRYQQPLSPSEHATKKTAPFGTVLIVGSRRI